MAIGTGTPDTRTEHSAPIGYLNELIAFGIPAALLIGGIATFGFDGISWLGALVWGIVAAAVMSGFVAVGRVIGMTTIDLLDLLGSTVYEPETVRSRTLGFGIHLAIGAILAVTGAYSLALIGWAITWLSGMVWGAFVSVLALLMLSSIGLLHPKIRAHHQADPGPGATHFGSLTPIGVIMGHLIYGLVFGGLYQAWPLA